MRIATFNVNGLRARLPFVLHWLRTREPDVVGLQEIKLSDEQFPHEAFEAAGFHAVVHGQRGWNGVAILSRAEARVRERGLPGQAHAGARLLAVELQELSFVTIYAPNGKDVDHVDFGGKLAWFEALAAYLREAHDVGRPLVVGGDFNVCPGPLDTWNEAGLRGTLFHTEPERACFGQLLAWGLGDCYRALFPEGRAFSWWDYRGGAFHRGQGLRIDFLLGTEPVRRRLRAVEIDREYRKKHDGLTPSDHAPVLADLERAPGSGAGC